MVSPFLRAFCLSVFLSSNLAFAANVAATTPVVDLGYAKYAGSFNATSGVTEFLGMRYAAPPTGTLRWQPPQPPATTSGVQSADSEPPTCYFAGQGNQATSPFRVNDLRKRDAFFPSEDCLFLKFVSALFIVLIMPIMVFSSVYLPGQLSASTKKLPVVVWIHGGGYMSGSASGFNGGDKYDGTDLIHESMDGVVVAVIQYRLGVFGFLPGKEVKEHGVLNAGLLDQQFALQWVQTHIDKFNGDPSRVTIWGQSAGAGSVIQHVVANGGKTSPPLFRAAITSSSFLPSQYNYNDRIPEILYSEVVSQSNCSDSSNTLDCLRNVPATDLETVNGNVGNSGFFGVFLFVPVVDGELIQERPTQALQQGKVNGEIALSVTNAFEGELFINPDTPTDVDVANYVAQLFPNFDESEIAATVSQYEGLGTGLFQVTAIMGESIFICPSYFLQEAFGDHGFKAEFAVPPAIHGNDVAYYYISTNGPPLFNNTDFIKAFAQIFTDFAISLDPNDKVSSTITPAWGRWEGQTEMLFNRTESGLPDVRAIQTSSALLERCQFWRSVSASTSQ
ncbi:hypothetical protein H0H92_002695 [Tricholoma furcatifolium]|nr:hypothetical protein H0H92_002695 [Tricholoma furcatifolium]